jgi:hypothetical protein
MMMFKDSVSHNRHGMLEHWHIGANDGQNRITSVNIKKILKLFPVAQKITDKG